jgi:hypothetical protein
VVVFRYSAVSPTNKTDPNDITEILLKVTINTVAITLILEIVRTISKLK